MVDKENDGRVHIPWLKISEWADIYNGKDLFLGSLTNFALNESRYESTKMWMNAARDHLIWQRNNLKPFGMYMHSFSYGIRRIIQTQGN